MRVLGFDINSENINEITIPIFIINNLIKDYPFICLGMFLMYFFRKQLRRFFDIFLDKLNTKINN